MSQAYLIDAKSDSTKKAMPFDILKYMIEGSHPGPEEPKYPRRSIKNVRMWLPNSNAPIYLQPSGSRSTSSASSRGVREKAVLGLTNNRVSICLELSVQDQFAELYIEGKTLSRIRVSALPQNDIRRTTKKRDMNSSTYYVNMYFDTESKNFNDSRVVLRSAVMDRMSPEERRSFNALIRAVRIDFRITCKREHIKDAITLAKFKSQRHETRQKHYNDNNVLGYDDKPQSPNPRFFQPSSVYGEVQNQRSEKVPEIYDGLCTCGRHTTAWSREGKRAEHPPPFSRAPGPPDVYGPSNLGSAQRFPGNFHFPGFNQLPFNPYYDLYQWLNGNTGWNM